MAQALLLVLIVLQECFDSIFVLVYEDVEVDQVDTLDDAVLALDHDLLLELAELGELK